MLGDLAFEVERYAALVDDLPRDEEPEEVEYTLLYRDSIHDRLKEGEQLTPELARKLAEADDRLLAMREELVRRFPDVFLADRAPREYWWWHLAEGPRVREQAKGAA